jgi:pimeloyl-ACP methyl ester carboxylesterase
MQNNIAMKKKIAAFLPKLVGFSLNMSGYLFPNWAANKAAMIFSTPQKGRIKEKDMPFLEGSIQQKLSYQDIDIHTYLWDGEGPTILLAHGWESNSARWRNFVKKLRRKKCRIVAVDAPAHGQSGSKVFNAILYAHCLEVAAKHYKPDMMVGHSAGGVSAMYLLTQIATISVKKLVILAAPSELSQIFGKFYGILGLKKHVSQGLERIFEQKYEFKVADFSLQSFAHKLTMPGLVIYDEEDEVAPHVGGVNIANNWKQARLISTKGIGHSLYSEEVTNEVCRFLLTEK